MWRCSCRLRVAAKGFFQLVWKLLRSIFLPTKKLENRNHVRGNWEEDWQDFSVSVVPNTPTGIKESVGSASGESGKCLYDDGVNEVLNEMQPVLKRTKMVHAVYVIVCFCV